MPSSALRRAAENCLARSAIPREFAFGPQHPWAFDKAKRLGETTPGWRRGCRDTGEIDPQQKQAGCAL